MTIEIASPLAGWVTPLTEVPDPVFAERMLGDGVAIDPTGGVLAAPGDGVIETLHPAGHAVTIALDAGPVLLLHIGLDTVGLDGEGFTPRVAAGDRVRAGDPLIAIDLDAVGACARSLLTPIVVTNGETFVMAMPVEPRLIAVGDPLLTLRPVAVAAAGAAPDDRDLAQRTLPLPLAHGLHARPAARIAALARQHDAAVTLATADGRTASAASAVAMLALALRHGETVTVRGPAPAVAAIGDLIERGMGEHRPVGAPTPVETAPPALPDRLTGITAVPGLAIGRAWRLPDATAAVVEEGAGAATERAALDAARAIVRAQLAESTGGTGDAAAIAAAHLAFLDDPELAAAADRAVAAGKSAGFAWRGAIEQFVAPLAASGDARFAERIDDLRDLERRVLAALAGDDTATMEIPADAILIADDLFPSQLLGLKAPPAGLAVAKGGATSHVAIIAGGMGVPMLTGLGAALALVEAGTPLILADGALTIAPDESVIAAMRAEATARAARRKAAARHAHQPATTIDGTRIEVVANLGSAADAEAAVAAGAEGCGLLRTEFLFLDRASPPGENEQRDAYQAIADALGDRPLIVRTLDIGADKPAPWLDLAAEENPALGLRGVRLQLARRDLLEAQLRALLATRSGDLKIMLPMVADRAELAAVRETLDALAAEAGVDAPALGIMVETPAAALTAASLAEDAAFFSIGSNDLAQYALARDRTNPAVAAGLDGLHPAVLRLIDATVRGGAAHGRWTGVCGGLAADADAVPLLLGLGVTELSVPGAMVAEIKALVRTLDLARCRDVARGALDAPDAGTARALGRSMREDAA